MAAAAGTTLALVSCTATAKEPTVVDSSAVDLGMEHVHGLGVDPADGALYAATHFGLWRIPESGEATRVADRYQDTMGLAVVGPGSLLASGHPDFRMDPDLPTRLGLIRSTDAGETWQSVSLLGEADLHVVRVLHGRIYAWDGGTGQVMVPTDDGATWDPRGVVPLTDLAVSPVDPDTLVATAEEGQMRSADGGRTWNPVPNAPTLAATAWPAPDSLYGVTPAGALLHSSDGGATWQPHGGVTGTPEALTVDVAHGAEVVYLAVSGAGILSSRDAGATFTVRHAG